jgi:hypothetical protein
MPACPSCSDGEICQQVIRTCDTCQSTVCAPATSSTASAVPATPAGPNTGAIAGGVIGAIAGILILTYLIWRFRLRSRRGQYHEQWLGMDGDPTASEKDFEERRRNRSSIHTVHSIASTVLTRASNIIQIAYIPGVMNRSAPTTPGHLVPPVPPIPIMHTSSTPNYEDQHFFIPGDLRDSTYSGMTDRTEFSSRTSYARTSVASTIYGRNAIVSPVPAQQAIRGRPAVVSVKGNSGGNTPADMTPPVPTVDWSKYNSNGPPSPAFSVGSTFLNNATSATTMRPQVVSVAAVGTPKSKLSQHFGREEETSPGHDSGHTLVGRESRQTLGGRESVAITLIEDTPSVNQGPFRDPPSRSDHRRNGSLSAVIEEATKKAQKEIRGGLGLKAEGSPKPRDQSPFGDEHETGL